MANGLEEEAHKESTEFPWATGWGLWGRTEKSYFLVTNGSDFIPSPFSKAWSSSPTPFRGSRTTQASQPQGLAAPLGR